MPSKTQSILLGALVSAVLGTVLSILAFSGGMALQVLSGCGACLAAFVGPMVAVWHYTSTHGLTVSAGSGAGLGAITGVVGAVISAVLAFVFRAVGLVPTVAEMQEQQREMMVERGMDPAQIDQAIASSAWMSGPVAEIVIGLLAGAIVGAIGGAIAASIFKKGGVEDV